MLLSDAYQSYWSNYSFVTPEGLEPPTYALKVRGSKKLINPIELHGQSLYFAPQVGLEPTTYGLTVRRSNQLSY